MSQERALDAKQLADMAHAALDMGLVRIGQELIDAAYELANGREVSGLDELIASLWQVLDSNKAEKHQDRQYSNKKHSISQKKG